MWLFKRTRHKPENQDKDSVGTKLGKGIIKLQKAFAERLNVAAATLSVGKMKRALFLFCLVSGGFSIYLAMNGLLRSNTKNNAITIDQASVPKHFDRSGDEVAGGQTLIDEEVYRQVKAFRVYADSLQKNNTNAYDSLMYLRPGLLDSVKAIEEIYLSQQIK